ncbi:MAG: alpha/beta hydrolase family protein [Alphaproteobacteria bacterium]
MGAKRFHAQKWLLDSVISTVGLDWDQLRMAVTIAPSGFEGIGDWNVIARTARRYDEITPAFMDGAERRQVRAKESAARGDIVTARESYLIASIYYGIAQWPIDELSDLNKDLNARKVACYSAYAAIAHHKIERVDIPMGSHTIPGWLHIPIGAKAPYPVVIMLPGMDTFKEKLVWAYGDKILERGMAALAIDGPGQSEALINGLKITADNFADTGRACVKWIDSRKDLDHKRIGIFGRSFGSYAGTVMGNAVADRLSGVAVGLPCHEPGFFTIFEEASPTFKNRFMFMAGYTDEDAFDKFMQGFDLRKKVSSLTCPYMVVGGDLDELSPIKHTYELSKHVPGKVDLVIYQNERHAPGRATSAQFGPHWYSTMADWLAARVRDGKPLEKSQFRFVKSSGQVEERPMP